MPPRRHVIRVVLPQHLQTLARADSEVALEVTGPATLGSLLDALEERYPVLRGTVRDHTTQKRRAFVRFLTLAGHEVVAAACGRDAVTLGAAVRPYVGLVDLTLPDIDGLEVGRRLRHEIGDDVVLFAVTARNQMRDREASARAPPLLFHRRGRGAEPVVPARSARAAERFLCRDASDSLRGITLS